MESLSRYVLTLILIISTRGLYAGDIVHHDDKSPKRPGCDNNFVLFNLGVILYILLCGVPPFWAETEQGVAQEVLDHPWIQNANKAPNVSLSAEEVAGIRQGFDLMDTKKQGKINIAELKAGLQKLGHQIPDSDLQMLMVSCRNLVEG
ncbi:Calcium-binding EF-hand [Artemisia annua]|uniref:Calcium-binding EF-hand n=1 Tax=Artemisia annua TaxID=35608 RepID=A0A2U1LYR4_ARTAN|nr:Calcium-binding EF-hand [Artemisia annua]